MLHDEVACNIHKLEIVTNEMCYFFLRYIVVSLVMVGPDSTGDRVAGMNRVIVYGECP